jgi:NADPH:quinone reductase-like Zn-dependent oxidoreductase
MKAVTFSSFGGPEVLTVSERPDPVAGPGEVVVRIVAATVNPTDIMMRDGGQAKMMDHLTPPFVPGMEFSGHVHATGAGVALAVGTPVFGVVNPRRPEGGAHAEYVVVPAASVAALDPAVDLATAASVPMNGLTARMALELTGLTAGQVLLVTGGTGMLGSSVIQLAREDGLTVVAGGREADEHDLRALGVDVIVPRDADQLVDAVRKAFPQGVDALIDGALIGAQVSHAVRDGGTAVSLRSSHPIEDPRLSCHYVSVIAGLERHDILAALAERLADGRFKPRLAPEGEVPFTQAAQAHIRVEQGMTRGRVVLTF